MSEVLRVCVIGAGAMGTLFGTTLIHFGHDVVFVDNWYPLIYSVRQDPFARLRLSNGEEERVGVSLVSFEESAGGPYDLVVVFVKSSNTAQAVAAASSKGIFGNTTVVVTCQGGFDNAEFISSVLPDSRLLLHGCTKSTSKSCGPMAISDFRMSETVLWPYQLPPDSPIPPRVREVVALCNRSGLQIDVSPRAITERWKVLLSYPTSAVVSALCGLTLGSIWETGEAVSF